jgi:5'(3')-deoxyribonucleotidase
MGGCSSIPVYDGAKEAFTKLQELANIVVVTSPFTGSFTWAYERERWLERHFGVSYRDVIHAHEKYRIHGDIFLDDKPEHVDAWLDYWVNSGRDENVTALLWETDRTINATVSSMAERVKDWESVLEIVRGYYKYASKSRKMAE